MRIKAKYALVGCYSRHIAFRLQILYSFINQSLDYIPFPTNGTETVQALICNYHGDISIGFFQLDFFFKFKTARDPILVLAGKCQDFIGFYNDKNIGRYFFRHGGKGDKVAQKKNGD